MKGSKIWFVILLLAAAFSITGCWTDTQNYSQFVCERFGGDFDDDGSCSRQDCNDFDPNIYPGAPCDDGDSTTVDDMWTAECICAGN